MTKKQILDLVKANKNDFTIFNIPKKSGGIRRVFALKKEAKAKYLPLIKELNLLEPHADAVAYKKKVTIKSTLEKHKNFNHHIKFDFSDFFPSFTFKEVYPRFRNRLDGKTLSLMFWEAYGKVATQQGHPTSPKVTNLMMKPFDTYLKNALLKRFKGKVAYSRYADDILISTNIKADAKGIEALVKKVLKETNLDFLQLNTKKTAEMHHKGKVYFLGVCVSNEKKLTIGHEKRKYVLNGLKVLEKRIKKFESLNIIKFRQLVNYAIYINSIVENKIEIGAFLNCISGRWGAEDRSGFQILQAANNLPKPSKSDSYHVVWKKGGTWTSTTSTSTQVNTEWKL